MTPPVFSHGDLRLYLLSLLAESPRHGYDIIQALADRTGGTYTPSAGTIYPRLAKLEEEGLVTKAADGRKTVYEITDAGRTELEQRQADLEGIKDDLADSVRLIADSVRQSVQDAMKSLRADLAAAAGEQREAHAAGAAAGAAGASASSAASSREQLHRAEATINDFRGRVRTNLRKHVAHGGEIAASVIDELGRALDEAASAIDRALS